MKKVIMISFIIIFVLIAVDYYKMIISPCLNLAQNTKQSFQVVFYSGASETDLGGFTRDFKNQYKDSIVEKVVTDQQYIDNILKTANLKDTKKIDEIKADLFKKGLVLSNVDIKASVSDLGKLDDFKNFLNDEFNKFKTLRFKQFTGYTPEQFLAPEVSAFSYCISPSLILKAFSK